MTSSCAAVLQVTTTPKVYSEKDWNEQAPAEVEEKGRAADPMQKYRASKTLAERGEHWIVFFIYALLTMNSCLGPMERQQGQGPVGLGHY